MAAKTIGKDNYIYSKCVHKYKWLSEGQVQKLLLVLISPSSVFFLIYHMLLKVALHI